MEGYVVETEEDVVHAIQDKYSSHVWDITWA